MSGQAASIDPIPAAASPLPLARLDRVGIVASAACVVHCLAAPLLLLVAPVLGSVWSDPLVHWLLALLVLPLAGMVLLRGYRRHRRWSVALLAVMGIAGILAGLVLPLLPGGADPGLLTMGPGGGLAASEGACDVAGCCPTVVIDAETGAASVSLSAASVVTLLGSLCLVLAHVGNLWSCRCCSSDAACAG